MFGNTEVVAVILLSIFIPVSSRVTLYDILSVGEEKTENNNKQPSSSKNRQRWDSDEIYGNASPFNIKKYPPFQKDKMAYKVFEDILASHQVSNDVCMQSALKMCDIKPMALLLNPDDDACVLFKEFDMCIQREIVHCSGDDVTLVQTSLQYLMEGFQANGRCKHVTVGLRVVADKNRQQERETGARSCNPHETWQCGRHLISNLRGKNKTCDALKNFRHCIHRRTRSCSYEEAKYLRDASKGLSILQRHSHLC